MEIPCPEDGQGSRLALRTSLLCPTSYTRTRTNANTNEREHERERANANSEHERVDPGSMIVVSFFVGFPRLRVEPLTAPEALGEGRVVRGSTSCTRRDD
jgi:hypothetical protein